MEEEHGRGIHFSSFFFCCSCKIEFGSICTLFSLISPLSLLVVARARRLRVCALPVVESNV